MGTYGAYYVQETNQVKEQKMEVLSLSVAAINELELEVVRYDNIINELLSLGALSAAADNSSQRMMDVTLLNNLRSSDIGFLNSGYPRNHKFGSLLLETPLTIRVLPTVLEISQLYSDMDFYLGKILNEEQKVGIRTAYYLAYLNTCQALNEILLENADYLRKGDYSVESKRKLVDRVQSITANYLSYKAEVGLGGAGTKVAIRVIPGEGW